MSIAAACARRDPWLDALALVEADLRDRTRSGWRRAPVVVGDLSRSRLASRGPEETILEVTILAVIMALLVLVLAGYVPPALDAMDRPADDPDV
jgi:hypothetical protein